jgi:hypothetical protein
MRIKNNASTSVCNDQKPFIVRPIKSGSKEEARSLIFVRFRILRTGDERENKDTCFNMTRLPELTTGAKRQTLRLEHTA